MRPGIFTGIATYTAVFVLGYCLAGGCDSSEIKDRNRISKIEERLDNYNSRLEYIEKKVNEK